MEEKKKWARHFFGAKTVQEIASLLRASTGKVSEWTRDLAVKAKEEEKQQVINLWLACKQQNEISQEIGVDESKVSRILQNFRDEKTQELLDNPPESLKNFNLWQFSQSDNKLEYPGQIPSQIVENLLWYTRTINGERCRKTGGSGTDFGIVDESKTPLIPLEKFLRSLYQRPVQSSITLP